jgi:hypothetical protein
MKTNKSASAAALLGAMLLAACGGGGTGGAALLQGRLPDALSPVILSRGYQEKRF